MTHVFISYSHTEKLVAMKLAERLTEVGYDVWWDAALLGGSRFDDAIKQVINEAPVAIILWSQTSSKSDWVRSEANLARDRKSAVPVRIDDVAIGALPIPFQQIHTIEMKGWDGSTTDIGYQQILKAVVDRVGQATGSALSSSEADAKLLRSADEAAVWAEVVQSNDAEDYQHYLTRFGDDARFADIAKLRLRRAKRRSLRQMIMVGVVGVFAVAAVGLAAMVMRPVPVPPPGPDPSSSHESSVLVSDEPPDDQRCGKHSLVKAPAMNASFCIDPTVWKAAKADSSGVFYQAVGGFYLSVNTGNGFIPPADEIKSLVKSMETSPSTIPPVTTSDQPPLTANNVKWTAWTIDRPQADNVEHTIVYYFSNYSGYVLVKIYNYADPSSLPLLIVPVMQDFQFE